VIVKGGMKRVLKRNGKKKISATWGGPCQKRQGEFVNIAVTLALVGIRGEDVKVTLLGAPSYVLKMVFLFNGLATSGKFGRAGEVVFAGWPRLGVFLVAWRVI